MEEEQDVRVVNTRPTYLGTPSVKQGEDLISFSLTPGGNNLPASAVRLFEALDPKRGPGLVWSTWKANGWIRIDTRPEAVEEPLGPTPPADLSTYSDTQAQVLISVESSAVVLKAWLKAEKRADVKKLIKDRLAEI
jgi:hypothetical protein